MRVNLRGYCVLALTGLFLTACSERNVLGPEALEPGTNPEDVALRRMVCVANVRAATVSCTEVAPQTPAGVNADMIIGGQELHVRLSSANTSYDSGTQVFSTTVTVQNLLDQAIGTVDGVAVQGVKVFFHTGPTVLSGTGSISIANPTGLETFTSADQPYFLYNQIIGTFEISDSLQWQFNVDATVNTFSFSVLVSAPMQQESAPMHEVEWTGASNSLWENAANWGNSIIPDSSNSVAIRPDSLFAGQMPELAANIDVANLRVGYQSSINLAGFTANVRGNLDAPGALTNGTAKIAGADARVRGTVNVLEITGNAKLQGALTATGAVSITGSLSNNGHALSIILP